MSSFYLGYIQGKKIKSSGVTLNCPDNVLAQLAIPTKALASGTYKKPLIAGTDSKRAFFGSKNGTKFYTPGCKAGNRIKPENIIWFSSQSEAEIQGYSKASSC